MTSITALSRLMLAQPKATIVIWFGHIPTGGLANVGEREQSLDLVIEEDFAVVPEWPLDAEISDTAVQLCVVLLRYGQTSDACLPPRPTLSQRLPNRSIDPVDRAIKDLSRIGAVNADHRYDGGQRLTNAHHLRTSLPVRTEPPTQSEAMERNGGDLRAMEPALLEAGSVRIELQVRAHRALEQAGITVTRNAVVRGAHRLLLDRDTTTHDSTGGAA
jgi:hypothetical protein